MVRKDGGALVVNKELYQNGVAGAVDITLSAPGDSVVFDCRTATFIRTVVKANTISAGYAQLQGSIDGVTWIDIPDAFNLNAVLFDGFVAVGQSTVYAPTGYVFARVKASTSPAFSGSITIVVSANSYGYQYGLGTEKTLRAIRDGVDAGSTTSASTSADAGTLVDLETPRKTELDWSGDNPIYIGTADTGSALNASVWQIRKLAWSGSNPTEIAYANGSLNYDQIWDNRASLSYS